MANVVDGFFPFGLLGRALLESPLCWERYAEKFQLLLYLEQQQMEVDIKIYNIPNRDKEDVVMTRDPHNKKLLILEVMMFTASLSSFNYFF